jgi:ligand-binding sensor domain-containing protein
MTANRQAVDPDMLDAARLLGSDARAWVRVALPTAAPAGGLNRLEGGRWQHWTEADGLPHPNVTSILQARDGRVWVGLGLFQQGGCAVFRRGDDGRWVLERCLPRSELAGPKVRSLCQDRRGRYWLGYESDGLTIRDESRTLRTVTPADGLPSWEATVICEAGDGAIWLATLSGVVRISPAAVDALLGDAATGKD